MCPARAVLPREFKLQLALDADKVAAVTQFQSTTESGRTESGASGSVYELESRAPSAYKLLFVKDLLFRRGGRIDFGATGLDGRGGHFSFHRSRKSAARRQLFRRDRRSRPLFRDVCGGRAGRDSSTRLGFRSYLGRHAFRLFAKETSRHRRR